MGIIMITGVIECQKRLFLLKQQEEADGYPDKLHLGRIKPRHCAPKFNEEVNNHGKRRIVRSEQLHLLGQLKQMQRRIHSGRFQHFPGTNPF